MSYNIAGVKVLNEHLALGIFGLYGLGGYLAMRGGDKKTATPASKGGLTQTNGPPLNAASSEEESFIKQFMKEAEGDKNAHRMV
ncbi:hypothetical protein BDZ90DRAFT_231564 [Jaminaea rosea]|uniref:Uncharacterized protein n=1 Tax=Jaminaea rosea TaxID=1569628 RepID=A0A316UTG5_9BASI|nr:hypothetical protein BDZ90DRAFT_231564 [Jaminaea rosea]PWN28580.1 hypothetical protein BDZ90DRAFT_231564 [Jaminaea rosea]